MNLPDFSDALPRAVALDLDGTTLNSNSEMAPRTAAAIRALAETGMPMLIATARPARVLPKLVGADLLPALSVVQMKGALAKFETASNDDHGVAIVLEGLAKALTSRAT